MLAAIVVNWNRRQDVLECLASLAASEGPSVDLLVVDNASVDGSVEAIRERFPTAWLYASERNLGFAEGNNIALRHALERGYEYVLLLNNDAVIAPDAIGTMLALMREQPEIGIVAPAVYYRQRPEVIWSAGGGIDWSDGSVGSDYYQARSADLPATAWDCAHVSGCCMLVRCAAIREAGLLDPRFFMYFEETEWCVRIARRGYRIVVSPRAAAWHAIDPDAQEGSPRIAYYMTRNHLLFLWATGAPWRARVATILRQVRTVASLFIRPHTPARARGRVPMMRAMRDFALGRFGPLSEVAR